MWELFEVKRLSSGSETIGVFQVRRTCCPRRTTSRPPWWRSEPWWGSTRRSRATSLPTRTELSRSLPSPRSWSKTPWQYKVVLLCVCVCVCVWDGETRTKLRGGAMGGMRNTMMSDWGSYLEGQERRKRATEWWLCEHTEYSEEQKRQQMSGKRINERNKKMKGPLISPLPYSSPLLRLLLSTDSL